MSRSKFFHIASLIAVLLYLGLGSSASATTAWSDPGAGTPSIGIDDPQFGTGGGGDGCGDPDEFGIYSRPAPPIDPELELAPSDRKKSNDKSPSGEASAFFWLTLSRWLGLAGL